MECPERTYLHNRGYNHQLYGSNANLDQQERIVEAQWIFTKIKKKIEYQNKPNEEIIKGILYVLEKLQFHEILYIQMYCRTKIIDKLRIDDLYLIREYDL